MMINAINNNFQIKMQSKPSNNEKSKKEDLMEKFTLLKDELGEKIKNNDLEESFSIGNTAFTIKEWDKFIEKFDKQEEQIKEEIEEEIKSREEDEATDEQTLAELLGDRIDPLLRSSSSVPYGYLAKNGVINYKGVEFIVDEKRNELQLGDCSDRKKCMTVYLENGGKLVVNEENFGELSKAITMFSPEDVKRILCAMADYKKVHEMQQEIDEMENSIGEAEETIE